MNIIEKLFSFLGHKKVIKVENSHPELERFLIKMIVGKSRVKIIYNGNFLDKRNRIIVSAYRR